MIWRDVWIPFTTPSRAPLAGYSSASIGERQHDECGNYNIMGRNIFYIIGVVVVVVVILKLLGLV